MDNCPTCEREFKSIEDFPIIYVANFKRTELPEVIAPDFRTGYSIPETRVEGLGGELLPKEVLDLFKESEKNIVAYDGWAYIKSHRAFGAQWYSKVRDKTAEAGKEIGEYSFQKYLLGLEELIGQEVGRDQILPPWKKKYPRVFFLPYSRDFFIRLYEFKETELKRTDNKYKVCRIDIIENCTLEHIDDLLPLAIVGILEYEGRIKSVREFPDIDEKEAKNMIIQHILEKGESDNFKIAEDLNIKPSLVDRILKDLEKGGGIEIDKE